MPTYPAIVRVRALAAIVSVFPLADNAHAQDGRRTLRLVGPWEIGALDPAHSGYVFSRHQVAETLATVDEVGRVCRTSPSAGPFPGTASPSVSACVPVRSSTTAHPSQRKRRSRASGVPSGGRGS